jgi:hypothetical protein
MAHRRERLARQTALWAEHDAAHERRPHAYSCILALLAVINEGPRTKIYGHEIRDETVGGAVDFLSCFVSSNGIQLQAIQSRAGKLEKRVCIRYLPIHVDGGAARRGASISAAGVVSAMFRHCDRGPSCTSSRCLCCRQPVVVERASGHSRNARSVRFVPVGNSKGTADGTPKVKHRRASRKITYGQNGPLAR